MILHSTPCSQPPTTVLLVQDGYLTQAGPRSLFRTRFEIWAERFQNIDKGSGREGGRGVGGEREGKMNQFISALAVSSKILKLHAIMFFIVHCKIESLW